MTTSEAPVGSIGTAIRVIEALQEVESAGVSTIADHLDIPTSTAHDYLKTLERNELIIKEGSTYRVGSRFLEIGGYARSQNTVYRTAKPEIRKIANETGEHANLMIEEFGRGVFLCKREGEDAFELDTHVGKRVHLQTTALGKAILAFMSEDRLESIIEEHGFPEVTEHTITERETLFEELEQVRQQGFATDDEERIRGVRCVAAPIHGPEGNILAAISVSGPKSGIRDERFTQDLPDLVMQRANRIEVNLKYQ